MFELINAKQLMILLSVLLLAMGSAISVAYSVHLTRQNVGELSRLDNEKNALEVEWEKLLLEINMLAGYSRVELSATKDLGMQAPSSEQSRVLELKGNRQ